MSRGTPVWSRFLLTAVPFYLVATFVLWNGGLFVHNGGIPGPRAALWALPITAGLFGAMAIWYVVTMVSLTGSSKGVWSLPDATSVHMDVEPERALQHVLTLAESAFPWLRSSRTDRGLTLTRKGWWGDASVQVEATPSSGGTELNLRAGSVGVLRALANNLIARGMIARVLSELPYHGQAVLHT